MQIPIARQGDQTGAIYTEFLSLLGTTGVIEFRTGTPPSVEDADSGTLVATCALSDPAISIPTGNVMTFNTIAPDTDTVAGTVTYARIKSGGGTLVGQLTCGTTTEEIVFDDDVFADHDTLTVTSLELDISYA